MDKDSPAEQIIAKALDLIEEHSIQNTTPDGKKFEWHHAFQQKIDWAVFRKKAMDDLASVDTRTVEDVFGIIDRALMRLGDGHSLLLHPEYVRTMHANGVNTVTWAHQKKNFRPQKNSLNPLSIVSRMPEAHRIGGILHVIVPDFHLNELSDKAAYQNKLRDTLLRAAGEDMRGVIVDLRPNGGGSMCPMLYGLSPLLGTETLGYFARPKSETPWNVNYGATPDEIIAERDRSNFPLTDIPVAILSGTKTCSSGEAIFLAFRGRPHTQSFGTNTFGNSSGNSSFVVGDNITLALCTSVTLDRNRHGSGNGVKGFDGGPIDPDNLTNEPLEDAVRWLESGAPPLEPAKKMARAAAPLRPK
jgi:C-terminal processing protease CtpA/Prc